MVKCSLFARIIDVFQLLVVERASCLHFIIKVLEEKVEGVVLGFEALVLANVSP